MRCFTLLNTRNSGEANCPQCEQSSQQRFTAGGRLFTGFTGRTDAAENPGNSVLQGGHARHETQVSCSQSFPFNLLWLLHSGGKVHGCLFFNNCISHVDFTSNGDDVKWCSVIADFRFLVFLNFHGSRATFFFFFFFQPRRGCGFYRLQN